MEAPEASIILRFDETEEIKLLNKYHQFIEPFAQRMVGGVFEGSNRADFLQKDTLYVVKEARCACIVL